MNRNRTKRVEQLNGLRTNAYKHLEDINKAIELYGDSAIPNYRTAQRIIANLTRGPQVRQRAGAQGPGGLPY